MQKGSCSHLPLAYRFFRGLDFDRNPGHFYKVTVYATDKGAPPKSSSVNVRVTVTNVNDESPEFTSSKLEIDVDENAPIGTVIAIIQAIDLDGDAVTYYFTRKLSLFLLSPVCFIVVIVSDLLLHSYVVIVVSLNPFCFIVVIISDLLLHS